MDYVSAAVPFVQLGNRRGLTALQLMTDQGAADFYQHFSHCFEPHPNFAVDAVVFIEPDLNTPATPPAPHPQKPDTATALKE